jgi:hypothetical protein
LNVRPRLSRPSAQRIGAIGRLDLQLDAIRELRHADDIALPAQLQVVLAHRALGEIALDVVLLQIDERGPRMAGFGQQVERVDELVLQEDLADVPAHALVDHRLAAAEAVEDLQRALRETDGARAVRELVVVVDEHRAHALLREVDRGRKAHRPRPDDNHRIRRRRRGIVFGGSRVLEPKRLKISLHGVSVSPVDRGWRLLRPHALTPIPSNMAAALSGITIKCVWLCLLITHCTKHFTWLNRRLP